MLFEKNDNDFDHCICIIKLQAFALKRVHLLHWIWEDMKHLPRWVLCWKVPGLLWCCIYLCPQTAPPVFQWQWLVGPPHELQMEWGTVIKQAASQISREKGLLHRKPKRKPFKQVCRKYWGNYQAPGGGLSIENGFKNSFSRLIDVFPAACLWK